MTNTATATRWSITAAPKFAGMRDWDCTFCNHESLAAPVFLTDGGTVIAAGSGCAALALGRPRTAGRKVVNEAAAIQGAAAALAAVRDERTARYARALEVFNARHDGDNADLDSCRATYWQLGGAETLGSFPAWLATVAETGEVR